ncbi:hypothetical protein ACFQV2_13095 [Actinokineospora soli]|uniref:Uncharacterized protein n=1 Tax=Actinokineospora soli TaxID=1048753 RepID=A0ABW2TLD4_9PSEU
MTERSRRWLRITGAAAALLVVLVVVVLLVSGGEHGPWQHFSTALIPVVEP